MDATSAHVALASYDWQQAYELASVEEASATVDEEAERFKALADAAWWLGRFEACTAARERAYALFEQCGRTRDAGDCALWLFEHHSHRVRPAIAGAWLRRAHHALDDDRDCVEHAHLILREAEGSHSGGDLVEAMTLAADARDIARRVGSRDFEALTLQAMV